MNAPVPDGNGMPDATMEAMLQQLVDAQLTLGKSLSTTSQFLRFVLTVANENMEVIRTQLETLKGLASQIEQQDGTP